MCIVVKNVIVPIHFKLFALGKHRLLNGSMINLYFFSKSMGITKARKKCLKFKSKRWLPFMVPCFVYAA